MVEFLTVATKNCPPYPVYCGTDAAGTLARIWQKRWRQAVIIGDDNTLALFGDALEGAVSGKIDNLLRLSFHPGETFKTRESKAQLEDAMLAAGLDRQSCIVAVGGGIALDLAGYVAATYMRGIDHINVATSLLAQVDAAVGGKTAVNTPLGKNLVGAFHHPRAVLVDTAALSSLPTLELRNGLAEAIKHAVIADAKLFEDLEGWAFADPKSKLSPPPEVLIQRCVAIKAEVVAADEGERGRRQVLNFGHTVAHALEKATNHDLSHGQAVAIGMVVEGYLAQKLRGFPRADLHRLESLLRQFGLPTRPKLPFSAVQELFMADKKTLANQIYCSIPTELGTIDAQDGNWATHTNLDDLSGIWTSLQDTGIRGD